jgi:hypothetical protein
MTKHNKANALGRQEVEVHRLEIHKASGQKAASAYRKGCEGKQME